MPHGVTYDDLVAAGLEGLAQAARAYDPSRGVQFATYALPRIRGAMYDDVRSADWAGRALRAKAKHLATVVEHLTATLRRASTREEICHAMGLTPMALAALEADLCHTQVVHVTWASDELTDGAAPADPGLGPEEIVLAREARATLARAVESLPPRLRHIVRRRFVDGLTLAAVGAEMGVTESRASQICTEAIGMLRRHMVAYDDGVQPPDELAVRRARRRSRKPQMAATPRLAESA
jgi:RNA polymerase sigma factor for flagellar operon FliA